MGQGYFRINFSIKKTGPSLDFFICFYNVFIKVVHILKNMLYYSRGIIMNEKDKMIEHLQTEKEIRDRRLLNIEIFLGVITIVAFVALSLMAFMIIGKSAFYNVVSIVVLVVGFVLLITGIAVCIYIEQVAGYYECAKCHEKYVPSYNQSLWSMHIFRTKYMKCPKCNKYSWSKKVLK